MGSSETVCSSCGANGLQSDFMFCPYCGAKTREALVCSGCGREVDPSAKFCAECGTQIASATVEVVARKKKPASKEHGRGVLKDEKNS